MNTNETMIERVARAMNRSDCIRDEKLKQNEPECDYEDYKEDYDRAAKIAITEYHQYLIEKAKNEIDMFCENAEPNYENDTCYKMLLHKLTWLKEQLTDKEVANENKSEYLLIKAN